MATSGNADTHGAPRSTSKVTAIRQPSSIGSRPSPGRSSESANSRFSLG